MVWRRTSYTTKVVLTTKALSPPRFAFRSFMRPAHDSSTDVAPMINAQIQALPPQGGTVDLRSLTRMQFVDSQIVVDHPVNLLLGAATFACGAAISGPCIKVTRPRILK